MKVKITFIKTSIDKLVDFWIEEEELEQLKK